MRPKLSFLFFLILISAFNVQVIKADSGHWILDQNNDDTILRQFTELFDLVTWLRAGDNIGAERDFESGMRFRNITIPKGVTITNARIEVTAQGAIYGNDPVVFIGGQDSDTASIFSTLIDYKARPRTDANVSWSPTGWIATGEYNTTDLSIVVQEIIDRAGWVSGNDMAFFIGQYDGFIAQELAVMYPHDQSGGIYAVELYVEWEEAQAPDPDPDPVEDGEEDEVLCVVYREYSVSSITVIDGTYDVGWLNSTEFVDGNVYRVNETLGADCLEVRFNFTGIPEEALSLAVLSYCEYEGNPAHIINLEAWNFNSSEWVLVEGLDEHDFRYVNHSLSYGNYIENGTGNVWTRYVHVSNGAVGHYLTVDFLKLRAYVPLINLDAWSINWLTSLLWIGLLGIGTFNKSGTLTVFAGFLGMILGLLMLDTNTMVAISLILLNLYLIYTGSE